MGIKSSFAQSALSNYGKTIRSAPREVIFNRSLLLSSLLYALTAVPLTWDQGSSSVLATLASFQEHFDVSSGSDAKAIRNFVSLVFIGNAVGAALSFFINDRIGRLWSLRLYIVIWIVGQMVAVSAPGFAALYAARIISGLGIGALTVTGPISLAEIAPAEIRGLLTAWFTVVMGMAHMSSTFCVYGVYTRFAGSRLQFQVVWFSPCIFMVLCMVASFFLCESPRWLFAVDRHEDAVATLVKLRGLPASHPRVQKELHDIEESIRQEKELHGNGSRASATISIIKETFTVRSNLRRVQQCLLLYALPQLSGANSVSSYFVPILEITGVGGGTTRNIFLSGMYTMSKFLFAMIASFFFIDALGRRRSLFVGITCQMLSDIHLGVFVKIEQEREVSQSASKAAIAAIFIHAFGYSVGLLTLPYVFGGELWPNRIRSFGAAMSQTFHWLFIYAMIFALPSLLSDTDNWGAFIFFAGWCSVSILYVFLVVPEIAGLSVEEITSVFNRPWYNAHRRVRQRGHETLAESDRNSSIDDNKATVEMRE